MFAYVLTYILITGSANPVFVEIPNLTSVEHCRQVARARRDRLPRNQRMTAIACDRSGYRT